MRLFSRAALSAAIAALVAVSASAQPIGPSTLLSARGLAMGVSWAGNSQPPLAPEPWLPSKPVVPGADVGYLPANWSVNDAGAFVYTIPLDVPDGHLTPSLSLAYSSANRSNGELGVGWRLQGPSAVTRCGQNLTVDGAVAAGGRFCLDGQKLVAVPLAPGQAIGAYGAPGTQYRTESDHYARVTTVGNEVGSPERFKVELRSGLVREYRRVMVPVQSGSLSSVIAPPAGLPGEAPLSDAVAAYTVGAAVADRWVLEREVDVSGNWLAYDWSDQDADAIDPVTHGIEVRLEAIRYGHDDLPTLFRQVTIDYENRPDNEDFTWHQGVRSELRQRITRITAHAPSPRTMVPVWDYRIEYAPTLSRNGRSLLASVQKCGRAGPITDDADAGAGTGGCLWKKEFAWADELPGASAVPAFTTSTVKAFADPITWPVFDADDPLSWANQITAIVHPPVAHVLDLDGDGTDDLVLQASTGVEGLPTHIFRGQRQPNGTATALSQYSFFDGAMQPGGRRDRVLLQTARPVDLDHRGRDQLLTVRQLQNLDPQGNPGQGWTYEHKLFEWGPAGFGPSDLAPLLGIETLDPKRFNFADLDGDRRLDMVMEGEGADSGAGPAFFWWNKTWDVWMNQGGTLVKHGSVPLETKCPSQITDADGDGRGELVQLYDHDEVIGKKVLDANGVPTAIAWATHQHNANNEEYGYRQYECTAVGYLSANAAGEPQVMKNATSLTAPITGPAAARANATAFGRHAVPDIAYGDFNADGLEDEFSTQYNGAGTTLHAWVRWNTGQGYGPRVSLADFFPAGIDASWQVRQLIGDLDGDGDDDLVSLRRSDANGQPTLMLALSDGHGGFAQTPMSGGPGLFEALETYVTTRLGDFNGDGRPDLVGFTDPQTLRVRVQQPQYNERVLSVSNEPTSWPSVAVVYSNQTSDKPEPVAECAYPLVCQKRGMTVVRRVLSREHLVNPTAAELTDANARATDYSYENFVTHLRGRGSLGAAKVRRWDRWRPMEVVTEYDNLTEVGRGYYPGVTIPVRVTTVVPFALSNGNEPPDTSGPSQPATMRAYVTRTQTVAAVQALNQAQPGDAWGLTYDVHATDWVTEEWEQDVAINWSSTTSEHLSSTDPAMPHLYSDEAPASVLRTTAGQAAYDDFGNVTQSRTEVLGAHTVQVDNQFTNVVQPAWRIGQLYRQAVTRSDAADKVTRSNEFYYDGQGRLTDIHREKGHADPSIPAATHLSYDKLGNVTGVQVTARNYANALETRETRFEYAPAMPGWADERLHPSQVWSPGVAAYQPSTWMAIHPAYGVTVASIDANGVQTRAQIDDLARVVWTQRDGGPAGRLTFAGRPDTGGGFNGLVVTSTIVDSNGAPLETAQAELDAMHRTLRESDTAFDGTLRHTRRGYDGLNRLASISRPYADGSVPSHFTTYAYDALDRAVKTKAADGSISRQTYPTFFETHRFDADHHESVEQRDVLGRLVSSANLLGGKPVTTTYAYGLLGLEDVTDPLGYVTHTEYNLLGRPVVQDTPDAGRTTLSYSGFGEVVQSLHQKSGETLTREYDTLGRLTRQTGPTDEAQFDYDTAPNGLGQLAEARSLVNAQSADKVISRFAYEEESGRLTTTEQVVDGMTDRVTLRIDPDTGRLGGLDYPAVDGSLSPGLSLLYGYNATGYVDTVSTQAPGQNAQTIWRVTARNLDDALLSAAQGWGSPLSVQRHYVAANGRMDAMSVMQGNQAVLNLAYGFHPNGWLKSREDKVMQRQESFGYDALMRLTQAGLMHAGTIHTTQYSYDDGGNLLSVDGEQHLIGQAVPPLANRELNQYGSADPTFPQPHTLTGHAENGVAQTYTYDSRGRRITGGGLAMPDFHSNSLPRTVVKGGHAWRYVYDAFGSKVKETAPDGAATVYVSDLYERRSAPGQDTAHVFHVPGTDGAVADIVYKAQPQTYLPHYVLEDRLGSASVVIDPNGSVERRHYEPFGKRVNPDGSPYAGLPSFITAGFTGHEHENALGLINMRGRLYDPALKRFLSPDIHVPRPGFGQSWNPYSYVLNSPLNFVDPSGFTDEEICTNLADQSTCYPSSGNGGAAPGTDDFNACRNCNEDGSAKAPYGGDLNGQPMGPGFFNAGPKDGTPDSVDGRAGSRVMQSSAMRATTVTGTRGGNVDPVERLDRDDDATAHGLATSKLLGYQALVKHPPIDKYQPKKYFHSAKLVYTDAARRRMQDSHFARMFGARSPFAYGQFTRGQKMRWIAQHLYAPQNLYMDYGVIGLVPTVKTVAVPQKDGSTVLTKVRGQMVLSDYQLEREINRANRWIIAASSVLQGDGSAEDWGFDSIESKRLLQIAREHGAGSVQAAMQAANLGIEGSSPLSPDNKFSIVGRPMIGD